MSIFCVGLGITFLFIFILQKSQWWALFPVGSLFGISIWMLINSLKPNILLFPIFPCFGVGIAFFCIYLFSVQKQKMKFALITSLLIMSASIIYYFIIMFYDKLQFFWPISLMAGGILLLLITYIIEKRMHHANKEIQKENKILS